MGVTGQEASRSAKGAQQTCTCSYLLIKMLLQPGLVCYALCYPKSRRLLSSALMLPGSVKPIQDCTRTAKADEEEPGESPALMLAQWPL